MPYWIHAKLKDGASSVGVETAKDALAKLAELEHTRGDRHGLIGHGHTTGDPAGRFKSGPVRSLRLMADREWQRKFEEPISLPDGRALVTLHDADECIANVASSIFDPDGHRQSGRNSLCR